MKGWILAALVCRALDAGSSIAAFHHGSHEVIPWMPEQPKFVILVHVGIGASQTHALKTLEKSHPRRAKVLAGIAASGECLIAGSNLWQIRK